MFDVGYVQYCTNDKVLNSLQKTFANCEMKFFFRTPFEDVFFGSAGKNTTLLKKVFLKGVSYQIMNFDLQGLNKDGDG